MSGARHHSYVSVEVGRVVESDGVGVDVVIPSTVVEDELGRDLAAENAIPENAYLSQIIFVPALSSLIIVSLG